MTAGIYSYQPYTSVVNITAQNGGIPVQASGVLISPDEVLTSDRAVYNDVTGGIATNIKVTSSVPNQEQPSGGYSGKITYLPTHTVPGPTDYNMDHRYAIIHLSSPVIGGKPMGIEPAFGGGQVHVTGYLKGATGEPVDTVETVTKDPGWATLYGPSANTETTGSPVWVLGPDGKDDVVGLFLSSDNSASTNLQITVEVAQQIAQQVALDDRTTPAATVSIYDTTTGAAVPDRLSQPYSGPVSGIEHQYINLTPDSINVTTSAPNWFIHSGAGDDAINVRSGNGTNVLDGGTGSNFLVGGTGSDTFFVDDRGATTDIWSSVIGFHSGDAATVYGVTPSSFAFDWENNQGAAGATGLTLHATATGKPTASLTLAGFNTGDLSSGRLTTSFGHDAGSNSDYLYVKAV